MTRSNGQKLEHRKFYTNTVLGQAAKEVVESPSLEILKTLLDTFLCNLLQETCFSRGLE